MHRYVKKAERTTAPTYLCAATVEYAEHVTGLNGRTRTRVGRAVHCAFSRRTGERWSYPLDPGRLALSDWWNWLEDRIPPRGRVLVVSPVASDFLTLTRFWRECDHDRFRIIERTDPDPDDDQGGGKSAVRWLGQLVLHGVPDIVTARGGRGSVVFVSLGNYVRDSLPALARFAGVRLPPIYDATETGPPVDCDPIIHRDIILRCLQRLISWWISEKNGPWRLTAGQLVQSLWRTRFYVRPVCRHGVEEVSALEADALHGGRASVWYFGDVGDRFACPTGSAGPPPRSAWSMPGTSIHRVDVSSMYPFLLQSREYPTRLVGYYPSLPLKTLRGLVRHWGVIARVRLRTELAEFPTHRGDRVFYPVGEFVTTLAGPDLELALSRGDVVQCFGVAKYDTGRPFGPLMTYLLDVRAKARQEGNAFLELLFKQWANSFGGKFAQRSTRWEPEPATIPPVRWGPFTVHPQADRPDPAAALAGTDRPRASPRGTVGPVWHYRSLAGLAFRRVDGPPGANLLAAVFAYLTAYGRQSMLAVRDGAPRGSVLSQDTDGLYLTDGGLEWVGRSHTLTEKRPGHLRLVESHTFARWFTPKHYYIDGRWILAGVATGFQVDGPTAVRQYQTANPVRAAPRSAPISVKVRRSRVDLMQIPLSGHPDAEGWIDPPRLVGNPFEVSLQSRAADSDSCDC